MANLPGTEPEIDRFLAAFEDGSLPKEQWTHAAHVLTGACYVHMLGETAAIDEMRSRVSRYNEAVGGQNTATSGYHETITVFWIKLLECFRQNHADLERAAFAGRAVERFGNAQGILAEFYDFEVARSQEARRAWIPPAKPIDLANL